MFDLIQDSLVFNIVLLGWASSFLFLIVRFLLVFGGGDDAK